ncbi:tannase/feruloyl esterase family alpha/beta hydrolase [Actinosynnema sp. NPDC059797]
MRWAVVFAVLASLTPVPARAAPEGCAGLVGDYALPGARAHVTSAELVPAGAEPEHCSVLGHVEPAVRFHVKLPTTTYDGRYLQYGCGGFCGVLPPPAIPDCGPRAGGMAVATTDDGHVGGGPVPTLDGAWARHDRAARDDLAFRAPHVVSLAAKRVIAEFHGAPPRRSYFAGCSNGGREGLLLAQRYPHDFDGVIAGAPANYQAPLVVHQAWLARANTGADGLPVLTAAGLTALHDAVLDRCDGLDGLVDGQLEDPRRCHFDPAELRCPGDAAPTCLTDAQVDVVREVYRGPTDAHGRRLYPAGHERGSEAAWLGWLMPLPEFGGASPASLLADNYLRHLGYPIGAPHSSLADFRFTAGEFARLGVEGARGGAMALDLDRFRRAGGKLILWHGWNDPGIPPRGLIDYYERLKRHAGPGAERWARLFLVPGLHHCGGGDTLTAFDPLRELVDWVERGVAPDRVVATGHDGEGRPRTRPVFPYPLTARYDGTGSVDDAANFVPAKPREPTSDAVDWLGTYLHHVPGPVAAP